MKRKNILVSTLVAASAMSFYCVPALADATVVSTDAATWSDSTENYKTQTDISSAQTAFANKYFGTTNAYSNDYVIGGTTESDKDKGLVITNANNAETQFTGKVSGTGILAVLFAGASGGTVYNFSDASGFSGLFYVNTLNSANHTLKFTGTTETATAALAGMGTIETTKSVLFSTAGYKANTGDAHGTASVVNSSITAQNVTFNGGANYTVSSVLNVSGKISIGEDSGVTFKGASLPQTWGESSTATTTSIDMNTPNGRLTFSKKDDETSAMYYVASINSNAGDFNANNGKHITVDDGVTVYTGSLNNTYGINNLTVNGTLNVAETLKYSTGSYATNKISGEGTISAKKFETGNVGVYEVAVKKFSIGEGGITTGSNENGSTLKLGATEIELSANWTNNVTRGIQFVAGDGNKTVFNTNNYTATLSGALTGAGALEKAGEGTLKLTGTTNLSGAISVSGGTLELGGTVSLSSAIQNAGTVKLLQDVVFNLTDSLKQNADVATTAEGDAAGTVYQLINNTGSSGTTGTISLAEDFSALVADNFTLNGEVISGRSTVDFDTSAGTVTITDGVAATLVWAGTTGSNTWNTTSTNTIWKTTDVTGAATETTDYFHAKDNVVFNSSAASKTVNIATDSPVEAGTVEIKKSDTADGNLQYTFAKNGSGSFSTLTGTSLKINSGAELTATEVKLAFQNVEIGGKLTLSDNNVANSWEQLTFSSEGANLHFYDTPNNTALEIGKTVVNANATITAIWFGDFVSVKLGELSGSGNLSITGATNNEGYTYEISNVDSYSGTLSLTKLSGALALKFTGTTTSENKTASFNIGENVTFTHTGGGMFRFKEMTLGNGSTFFVSAAGGKVDFDTLNLNNGSTLKFQNGNSDGGQIGSTNSKIVVNGNVTIAGGLYGSDSNVQGTISGSGTVKLINAESEHMNNWKISAKIEDGTGSGEKLALNVALGKAEQTVTLSGANTFTGGVTVSAGTVNAAHADALGTGTTTLSGGQLSVSNNITLSSSGMTIVLGDAYSNDSGKAAITGEGTLTLSGDAKITLTDSLDSSTAAFVVNNAPDSVLSFKILDSTIAGTSTGITADSFTLGGAYADKYSVSYENGVVTLSLVPEPSAFGLLAGLGALALVASRRRRSRK